MNNEKSKNCQGGNSGSSVKAAVLGVTGYTGIELFRLLLGHPDVEVNYASSESYRGRPVSEAHPQFSGISDLVCSALNPAAIPGDTDIVFCALPHGKSVEVVPALLQRGFRVIDLSADFRLKNADLYPEWYDRTHPCPELLEKSVYGLSEINSAEIRGAELVANPGCYPTGILLALAPLLSAGLISGDGVIIDAKSGVSGAGRAPKQPFHFPECNDSFKAYRVATHQHTPEIEQEMGLIAARRRPGRENGREKGENYNYTITFTPHLVPMSRGILSTIYTGYTGAHTTGLNGYQGLSGHAGMNNGKGGHRISDFTEEELLQEYRSYYEDASFVEVLKPPLLPETRWIKGTNFCHLAIRKDQRSGRVIILSAVDNLIKGAAGQAVQNMNIMFNRPLTTGLMHPAQVP